MKKIILTGILGLGLALPALAMDDEKLAKMKIYLYMKKHEIEEIETKEEFMESEEAVKFYICKKGSGGDWEKMWECIKED